MVPDNKDENKIKQATPFVDEGTSEIKSNAFKASTEPAEILEEDGKINPELASRHSSDKNEVKLSEDLERFVRYYKQVIEYEKRPVSLPLHVDELASKVAKFYESVRQVIDWKEEHLIRRTAIERILKRSLLSEISGIHLISNLDPSQIAEPIVHELIRGGHFKNDSIPKEKIFEVQSLLKKYIYLLKNNPLAKGISNLDIKRKVEFYNWLLSIAACELEELLDPPLRETGLINLMTTSIYRGVKIDESENLNKEEIYLQTYITVHKTLFNLDSPIISYRIMKYRYPDLFDKPEETLSSFAERALDIWQQVKNDIEDPLGNELFKVCERYDVVYRMLGDVFDKLSIAPETMEERIGNPIELDRLITEAYAARVKTLKTRLFRSAVFSTLSIFLAGSVSLFIVEVPLAKLFLGRFSTLAIFVDIMIPTVLMFILVAVIRPPKSTNLDKILLEVKKVVYDSYGKNVYEVTMRKKKRWFMNLIFILLYLIGGLGSLIFVFWVFKIANVPWTSLYIDTVNVAVIVFAALVIRARAKELSIEEEGGFVEFIMDFFTIPLAKIGQWLSEKWKEYNFISVFFTALIDSPISSFITLFEEWRGFLKERKSEIR